MSDAGNEGPDLERWLERVRDGYTPPPATPTQRAAFEARLRERIEAPRRGLPWLPLSVGAGLAAAALAALLVLRAPVGTAPVGVAAANDAWADEILLEDGSAYGDDDPEDVLPPQYAAIASAWLE